MTSKELTEPPLANIPVRTVLPKARPLVWLDERFLLAGVDNRIVELDSRDSRIVHVVSEPYYLRAGYECFSREGGRFADFNLASQHWPLKGWWVTPDGQIQDWVILPNGPWIKSFSTLYTLRRFSCGPACYSAMRIWAGNGQLYISVWGDAIDTAVEGVRWTTA